jgi:uncharacterized damage-inducible protein DinB
MTTVTDNPITAPLAVIFSANDGLITRAIDGLSEDELWHRPSDHSNPMFWLVGHVVHTRGSVLRLLGEEYRTGWGEIFRRGAALDDRGAYPAFAEIQRVRTDLMSRMRALLSAATDDVLARPATMHLPGGTKTIADQIGFLAFHESYHVGQLAYIRKLLGYSGIAG